jgi:hypothetical protein
MGERDSYEYYETPDSIKTEEPPILDSRIRGVEKAVLRLLGFVAPEYGLDAAEVANSIFDALRTIAKRDRTF